MVQKFCHGEFGDVNISLFASLTIHNLFVIVIGEFRFQLFFQNLSHFFNPLRAAL